ncbi:MAG: helix-turn-helix transcriptional regulator [Asticcacaulis sp.]|uniref:helix-turn-helix transcriptional regulator n=1 Tax=Asticcacaulis sp. TaxID=1872648 RepID=UPI003F7BEF98
MGHFQAIGGHLGETYRFEDFVCDCTGARTTQGLFELFTRAMARQGFDRIIFSVPRDLDVPEEQNRLGLFHNYPEDWQAYYDEKGFAAIDPVLRAAGMYDWAFEWSGLERDFQLSDRQTRFMRLGEEAGLHNGVGVPFRGSRAQIAGVALATSRHDDERCANLDLINAYCTQFYVTFKRLAVRGQGSADCVFLTPKESEILCFVANGCTDDDIADKLSISRNTVDTHLRHIFHKLDVNSRVAASVKAITAGLIFP